MLRAFITAIFFMSFVDLASAAEQPITQDMVENQHRAMESALNARADRAAAVQFLDDHISDDARYSMTVNNPGLPDVYQDKTLEMSKSDYINTFIQGTNFIAGYHVDIQMTDFSYDAARGEAVSTAIMTERGAMVSPLTMNIDEGKPFISRTTCRTHHVLQNNVLVIRGGECHTDVSYEQLI